MTQGGGKEERIPVVWKKAHFNTFFTCLHFPPEHKIGFMENPFSPLFHFPGVIVYPL
jgi:hypothetical protein